LYGKGIRELADPLCASLGMEVIHVDCVRMKTRWLVRVYLDKAGGVTLDDCSQVSGQLGDILDVHDLPPGPYTLEVSSPGPDRPLSRDKDFLRYVGHFIRIRLHEKVDGMKHFRGKLVDFVIEGDRKTIVLEMGDKRCRIPCESLLKANLEDERGVLPSPKPHGGSSPTGSGRRKERRGPRT